MRQWWLALIGWLAPAAVAAQTLPPLPAPAPDGRVLGHLPYAEANPADLVAIPAPFGLKPCRLHRDAAASLAQLLRAAEGDPVVKGQLRGVSCFRSIARQGVLFCQRTGRHCVDPAVRARSSAPPGYSEHATGYALDFGLRPFVPGCRADVDDCIAATRAGQWLLANAPAYGFELSFPCRNAQGVSYEPWHWRWVGASAAAPGAAQARAVFAAARARFPAHPAIPDSGPPALLPVVTTCART